MIAIRPIEFVVLPAITYVLFVMIREIGPKPHRHRHSITRGVS
jgi:hypothetical protein